MGKTSCDASCDQSGPKCRSTFRVQLQVTVLAQDTDNSSISEHFTSLPHPLVLPELLRHSLAGGNPEHQSKRSRLKPLPQIKKDARFKV